jgi:hypothetical protein
MRLTRLLNPIAGIFRREPDFYIGGKESPYMLRWWIIPRNRFFNIYLHKFLRDDEDRAIHDHPWVSCSIILRGRYKEHAPECSCSYMCGSEGRRVVRSRKAGSITFRTAAAAHRIELYGDPEKRDVCWSLFLTGPRIRDWGFLCPKRWVPWQQFCDETDQGNVGRGCE